MAAQVAERQVLLIGHQRDGEQGDAGEAHEPAAQDFPLPGQHAEEHRDAVADEHGVEAVGGREELDVDLLVLFIETGIDNRHQSKAGC